MFGIVFIDLTYERHYQEELNYPANIRAGHQVSGANLVFNIIEQPERASEPATMILLGSGLLGLWRARKKFKK